MTLSFFFFNDTATTEIYTLSLHDALPILNTSMLEHPATQRNLQKLRADGVHIIEPDKGEMACGTIGPGRLSEPDAIRSEEHTSELQSPCNLVCRLLLEKKKNTVQSLAIDV